MGCRGFGVLINSNDAKLQGGFAKCLNIYKWTSCMYVTHVFSTYIQHREPPMNTTTKDLYIHKYLINTCILSLLPSHPSQLLLSCNNNMLLLPSNASSLEDKKYLIVFLPFTAAASRSTPLKVDEGGFLFSLLVFICESLCACEMTTCTKWTRHDEPLNTERYRPSKVSNEALEHTVSPQRTLVCCISWTFLGFWDI